VSDGERDTQSDSPNSASSSSAVVVIFVARTVALHSAAHREGVKEGRIISEGSMDRGVHAERIEGTSVRVTLTIHTSGSG
jgi:hypothetical protein